MTAPSTHPVEILFARADGGRIRIDGLSGGRRCRGQGEAYDSAPLIMALTTLPRAGTAHDAVSLAEAGFARALTGRLGSLRYDRTGPRGLYTLTLSPDGLDLSFTAEARDGSEGPVALLRLSRAQHAAVWPADCASEDAHIAVALAIVAHHERQAAAH